MKKTVVLFSVMLASFTFASTGEKMKTTSYSTSVQSGEQREVTLKNGTKVKVLLMKSTGRWKVEFLNACGDFCVVFFSSSSPNGSPEFNHTLAEAVNSNYDC